MDFVLCLSPANLRHQMTVPKGNFGKPLGNRVSSFSGQALGPNFSIKSVETGRENPCPEIGPRKGLGKCL